MSAYLVILECKRSPELYGAGRSAFYIWKEEFYLHFDFIKICLFFGSKYGKIVYRGEE